MSSPQAGPLRSAALELAVAHFKENGYAIIEGVLDAATIDRCRDLLAEHGRETGGPSPLGGLIELDPDLALTLAGDSRVLAFTEAVMGPFVQLDGLTLVPLNRSDEDGKVRVAGWHRDPWGQVPRSGAFERPLAVNALCYLQDMLEEPAGLLRVIRGSHRMPLEMPVAIRREPHALETPVTLRAGDYVIVHNNLVHTATPPEPGGRQRDFISVFYNLTWLKPTVQCAGPRAQELIGRYRQRRDYRMLRLLGVDEHLAQRNDCGFLERDDAMWARWAAEDRAALEKGAVSPSADGPPTPSES